MPLFGAHTKTGTHTNAQNAHTLLRGHGRTHTKATQGLKSYSGSLSARMGKEKILPHSLFHPLCPSIIILPGTLQKEFDKSDVES